MSHNILISICILTYNHEDYIEQCLQSIANQEKKFEIELLISDDCSLDSTVEVINNFVLKNNISVTLNVNSDNKGVIGNLIELLKMCKGKYIAFCEGDDYWIDEKKVSMNEKGDVDVIMSILKDNQEFKNMMIEQSNEYKNIITSQNTMILDLINTKNNITNITNNKTVNNQFNLNLFLNETCRDAMNINEFIENIQIQTKELENVGINGYVNGITDIILSRLKQLDVSKRPLHCTDIKRETLYIKDQNEWNRDTEEKTKIKTMITKVAKKNLKQIPVWREQNPECKEPENEKYDFCIKMMRNSLGEIGDEQIKLDDKIIKNIAKQVMVDKNT